MPRPRRPNEPSTYETQPEIPPELRKRYELIRAVLAERTTISDAAAELGIARVNMQSLVHRAEQAIAASLQPRSTGPKPKPIAEKTLEARVTQLEKENAKLQKQLQAADDMMMAAGEIIRSLRGLPPTISRSSSPRSKRSPKPRSSDDDPEPERPTAESTMRRALERLRTTSRDDVRAARLVGVSVTTLRRWLARLADGVPLHKRRGGVMRVGPRTSEDRVCQTVRDLHGMLGAESLARSVVGVSRRRAAQLKREVLTTMERERKAACAHVQVTEPGVVRGFDAMYLRDGYALHAADASVPYRTSIVYVPAYDAAHVAAVLDDDFHVHGAPLVLRDDRASCHTAPAVLSVLEHHGVALLQGPAYYAPYYGQLERQNLEHRGWLAWLDDTCDDLQTELDRMKSAFNERWLRPTLEWRSAAEIWSTRRPLDDERSSFLDDVRTRAARLRARHVEDRLAMRLAIEQALTQRGYLRITPGRTELCE